MGIFGKWIFCGNVRENLPGQMRGFLGKSVSIARSAPPEAAQAAVHAVAVDAKR